MTTLLATERIKLFSTRSPWWSALAALVLVAGFTALIMGLDDDGEVVTVASTQFGYSFGLAVVLVLAALAVTTEYRFGTIRTTFQAVPGRTSALLAKTGVVAAFCLVIGEITAFAAVGISMAMRPEADLALNSSYDWINVAGVGLIYALAAVIAIAVGIIVRHSAGAIALLMIWVLAVEELVVMIPNIGDDIRSWVPFNVANKFLTGNGESNAGREAVAGPPPSSSDLDQWWALGYFAAIAAVLLGIALYLAKKRDA